MRIERTGNLIHVLTPWSRFIRIAAILLLATLFAAPVIAQDNTIYEISGQVLDDEREPLPDVSVQIKGSVSGTITNKTGNFVLRTKQKIPFTLIFSSIGFRSQELEVTSLGSKLQVAMVTQTVLGN